MQADDLFLFAMAVAGLSLAVYAALGTEVEQRARRAAIGGLGLALFIAAVLMM